MKQVQNYKYKTIQIFRNEVGGILRIVKNSPDLHYTYHETNKRLLRHLKVSFQRWSPDCNTPPRTSISGTNIFFKGTSFLTISILSEDF